MKKIILTLVFIFICHPVFSSDFDYVKYGKAEVDVPIVGYRLLNSNKIKSKVIFLIKKDDNKIYKNHNQNTVVIDNAALKYVQDKNELAAVIAHKISHDVDLSKDKTNNKNYDTRTIDYMANAQYNPLAYIVLMNRIKAQDKNNLKLSYGMNSKKLSKIYKYITMQYPQYLTENKYTDDTYYKNFVIASKNGIKKSDKK